MHVLLVLEQRAVQRRDGVLLVLGAQASGGMSSASSSLSQSISSLVDGFFFRPGHFAQFEEDFQRFAQQSCFSPGNARRRCASWSPCPGT
jgi:hypothetical protein